MRVRQKRSGRDKVTLTDVAERAGVSAITVSRVLREPHKVSLPRRRQILTLIEEMGYVPDFAARALASNSSGVIGVLVPSLSSSLFQSAMRGIEERVRESDLRIQYANSHYDPVEEMRQLRLFMGQRPAGIMLAGVEEHEGVNELLRQANCPVVQIVDIRLQAADMAIGIDHRSGAMAATRHLLERGYRRIGSLGGGIDIRARNKLEGYRNAMTEVGLFDPALVVSEDAPTSVHLGCRLLHTLLEHAPDADAVFCQNDDIALGVMFECQRLGIRIPEDFGVCGFNDLEFASFTEPGLTTVRVPRFEIGYRAVDMLIRAGQGDTELQKRFDIGFQIVERGTVRRAV